MIAGKHALSADATRTTPVSPTGWFSSSSAAAPPVDMHALVLVVAEQAATRAALRSGLCGMAQVRVVEAVNVGAAVDLSRELVLHLVVTDTGCATIARALPWLQTVVVGSASVAVTAAAGPRAHWLHGELVPETLRAAVRLLLQRR